MSFMNCPRCGLSVRLRAPYLRLECCPRCLARRRASVQMYISERPGGVEVGQVPPPAEGWHEGAAKVPAGKEFGLKVPLKRGDSEV